MEPLAAMAAVAAASSPSSQEHSLRPCASHEMKSSDSISASEHRRRLMRRNSTGSSRKGFLNRSNSKLSQHTNGSNRSLSTAGTNDSGRSDKSNKHLKSSRNLQRRSSLSNILSRGKHKSNHHHKNDQNNHALEKPQSQTPPQRNKSPTRKLQRRSSLSHLLRRSGGSEDHKHKHSQSTRKGASGFQKEDSQHSSPSQELLLKQSVSSSSSITTEKRRKPIHRTSSLPTYHKQPGAYSNAELMMSVLQHPNDPDNIYHQQQKRAQSTARQQQRRPTVTDWDNLRSPSVARSKTAGRRRASASSISTFPEALTNHRTLDEDYSVQHTHSPHRNYNAKIQNTTSDTAPPTRSVRRTASLDATQSLLDLHLEQQKRQPPLYNGFVSTATKNNGTVHGDAFLQRRQQRRHPKETESVTNATEMSSTASSLEFVREAGRNEARESA